MSELEEVKARAIELDLRRQQQIANQVASINRLLKDGTYTTEMGALHEELVDAQEKLRKILEILEPFSKDAYDGKRAVFRAVRNVFRVASGGVTQKDWPSAPNGATPGETPTSD